MLKEWLIALLRKWPYWSVLIVWEIFKDWLCQIARDFVATNWGTVMPFLDMAQQYNWIPLPVVGVFLLVWTWLQGRQRLSPPVSPPENKLTLVARAIMEAKQVTPAGKDVTVYITDSNKLTRIYIQELKSILVKLQDDERVITLKSFPDDMTDKWTVQDLLKCVRELRSPFEKEFVVNILNAFDKWYKTIARSKRG